MHTLTPILAALANPTRCAILELLLQGPHAVGDIAAHFAVTRPAISQHLRVLKRARLVRGRAEGNRTIYSIDATGLGELRGYLDDIWPAALASLKKAADREHERRKRRS